MIGGGEAQDIIQTPTLAQIMREINRRPNWQTEDRVPVAVDHATFETAKAEMKEAMERQGRPVAVACWIQAPNFLLRGIPVVIA